MHAVTQQLRLEGGVFDLTNSTDEVAELLPEVIKLWLGTNMPDSNFPRDLDCAAGEFTDWLDSLPAKKMLELWLVMFGRELTFSGSEGLEALELLLSGGLTHGQNRYNSLVKRHYLPKANMRAFVESPFFEDWLRYIKFGSRPATADLGVDCLMYGQFAVQAGLRLADVDRDILLDSTSSAVAGYLQQVFWDGTR